MKYIAKNEFYDRGYDDGVKDQREKIMKTKITLKELFIRGLSEDAIKYAKK